MGDILNLVHRAISTYLIKKAGLKKKSGAKTGSVTFIQRFGGSLNLNIHFHIIYLDGVYTFDQKTTTFHLITPPTKLELDNLLKTIAQRTVKLLEKRGLIVRNQTEGDKFLNVTEAEAEAMDQIHASSITYRIAFGKYKGQKALTLRAIPELQKLNPFLSQFSGFNLHAGIYCPAKDKKKRDAYVVIFQDPASVKRDSLSMLRAKSSTN